MLKQVEGHVIVQARCLTEELDLELAKAYKNAWEDSSWEFNPELFELFAQNLALLHTAMEGELSAHPDTNSILPRLVLSFISVYFFLTVF